MSCVQLLPHKHTLLLKVPFSITPYLRVVKAMALLYSSYPFLIREL